MYSTSEGVTGPGDISVSFNRLKFQIIFLTSSHEEVLLTFKSNWGVSYAWSEDVCAALMEIRGINKTSER